MFAKALSRMQNSVPAGQLLFQFPANSGFIGSLCIVFLFTTDQLKKENIPIHVTRET